MRRREGDSDFFATQLCMPEINPESTMGICLGAINNFQQEGEFVNMKTMNNQLYLKSLKRIQEPEVHAENSGGHEGDEVANAQEQIEKGKYHSLRGQGRGETRDVGCVLQRTGLQTIREGQEMGCECVSSFMAALVVSVE